MVSQTIQMAKKIVPAPCKLMLKARRKKGHWFLRTPDRQLLEREIIPYFAELDGVGEVLDVGKDWYTAGYPKLFPKQHYRSIDIDPDKERIARGAHYTASLLELDSHFGAGTFDLVKVNGVFGWGVDGEGSIARAMSQVARALRPGGFVVIGWNDTDERRPEPLSEMLEAPGFEPFALPGIGAASTATDTAYRHIYHFSRSYGSRHSCRGWLSQ